MPTKSYKSSSALFKILPISSIVIAVCIILIYSSELSESVRYGIKISVSSIIPAIFPFLIFSDYLSTLDFGNIKIARRIFENTFHIASHGLTSLIIGLLCGFPSGIKSVSLIYDKGMISREDGEYLCGFINNPSLAYVISGVGMGMRNSLTDGIALYITVTVASLLTGILFRSKSLKSHFNEFITQQNFNLTTSIKDAGYASVAISSYIIFFCTLSGLFEAITKNEILVSIFCLFSEVGGACIRLSRASFLDRGSSFILSGFALGFSGFSVHLQAWNFMPKEFSRVKYLKMKFVQGLISMVIASIVKPFI